MFCWKSYELLITDIFFKRLRVLLNTRGAPSISVMIYQVIMLLIDLLLSSNIYLVINFWGEYYGYDSLKSLITYFCLSHAYISYYYVNYKVCVYPRQKICFPIPRLMILLYLIFIVSYVLLSLSLSLSQVKPQNNKIQIK